MIATEPIRPTGPQAHIKMRRVCELALYSAIPATATLAGWWWWQARFAESLALGPAIFVEQLPLLHLILIQKPLVLMGIAAEFLLIWALLLAITPMGWWIRADTLEAGEAEGAEAKKDSSPVEWLAQKITHAAAPADAKTAQGDPAAANAPTNVPTNVPANAPADGSPAQAPANAPAATNAPPAQQEGTQPQAQPPQAQPPQAQTQPPGEAAPAQPPNAAQPAPNGAQPAQPPTGAPEQPAQPGTAPASQPTAQMAFTDEDEEEESIASLTDVADILAAFNETEVLDPWLEGLSASLDDVEAHSLIAQSRGLLADLAAAQHASRHPQPVPVSARPAARPAARPLSHGVRPEVPVQPRGR